MVNFYNIVLQIFHYIIQVLITIESDFLKVRRCLLKVHLHGFDDKNEVCLLEILIFKKGFVVGNESG